MNANFYLLANSNNLLLGCVLVIFFSCQVFLQNLQRDPLHRRRVKPARVQNQGRSTAPAFPVLLPNLSASSHFCLVRLQNVVGKNHVDDLLSRPRAVVVILNGAHRVRLCRGKRRSKRSLRKQTSCTVGETCKPLRTMVGVTGLFTSRRAGKTDTGAIRQVKNGLALPLPEDVLEYHLVLFVLLKSCCQISISFRSHRIRAWLFRPSGRTTT